MWTIRATVILIHFPISHIGSTECCISRGIKTFPCLLCARALLPTSNGGSARAKNVKERKQPSLRRDFWPAALTSTALSCPDNKYVALSRCTLQSKDSLTENMQSKQHLLLDMWWFPAEMINGGTLYAQELKSKDVGLHRCLCWLKTSCKNMSNWFKKCSCSCKCNAIIHRHFWHINKKILLTSPIPLSWWNICMFNFIVDFISFVSLFYRTRVRSLGMLVSDSLPNSLTPKRLVNLIDVTLACEDTNSKLVDIVTVAIPDNCRRRGRRRQCKFFWPV